MGRKASGPCHVRGGRNTISVIVISARKLKFSQWPHIPPFHSLSRKYPAWSPSLSTRVCQSSVGGCPRQQTWRFRGAAGSAAAQGLTSRPHTPRPRTGSGPSGDAERPGRPAAPAAAPKAWRKEPRRNADKQLLMSVGLENTQVTQKEGGGRVETGAKETGPAGGSPASGGSCGPVAVGIRQDVRQRQACGVADGCFYDFSS